MKRLLKRSYIKDKGLCKRKLCEINPCYDCSRIIAGWSMFVSRILLLNKELLSMYLCMYICIYLSISKNRLASGNKKAGTISTSECSCLWQATGNARNVDQSCERLHLITFRGDSSHVWLSSVPQTFSFIFSSRIGVDLGRSPNVKNVHHNVIKCICPCHEFCVSQDDGCICFTWPVHSSAKHSAVSAGRA